MNANLIFWLSLAVTVYVYFGYPLVVFMISMFYEKRIERKYVYPTVSIILSAYNEEKNIEAKISSLLHLDYPEGRYNIIVGSDGSTDNTDKIVQKYQQVKLVSRAQRLGKPNMLNILAAQATGDILVFTDARQKLDRSALKELVRNFCDDKVGSVSAEMFFEDDNNQPASGLGLYWNYEKFIRKAESRIGSMLGATGALYAIRRELFPRLPDNLILDDVYIPVMIISKGYRAIFEPKARIYDRISRDANQEFLRKVRTLAGNYQLFMLVPGIFNPFKNPVALQIFSHKFLRLIVPFCLMLLYASNLLLIGHNYAFFILFVLQSVFYGLALIRSFIKITGPAFNLPYTFCVMNLAAVIGLYRFLTGKQGVLWEKAYS